MTKKQKYQSLVAKRKADKYTDQFGYKNQSDFPKYDSEEIGNYSMWANDLDADLMVIAQDYCDQETFKKCRGLIQTKVMNRPELVSEWETKTNYYLWKLLKSIGRDIGLPYAPQNAGVFLTNAVLSLKKSAMSQSLTNKAVDYDGKTYLKPLIEIIQPEKIITLGKEATASILKLYSYDNPSLMERIDLNMQEQFRRGNFAINNGRTTVIPFYHPGLQGQSGRGKIEAVKSKKGWDLMSEDWSLIHDNSF